MKFALNGALTVGTLDGANIEIHEAVGAENFFLFGLTSAQVAALRRQGYRPRDYYESDPELREALDLIRSGFFAPEDRHIFEPLVRMLTFAWPTLPPMPGPEGRPHGSTWTGRAGLESRS
jgi:starch phosphorylase